MRFELIDRITEVRDDGMTGLKTVSLAEEYLQDHFPSFPVLPGVMMLEAMLQLAHHFARQRFADLCEPLIAAEIRNARYGNMVRPGQTLVVSVTLRRHEPGVCYEFEGSAEVENQVAVQARFKLVPVSQLDGPVIATDPSQECPGESASASVAS